MNKICKIYVITNTVNDKIYVGQTWRSLISRFSKHANEKGCAKIHNAIKKYGKNKFTIKYIALTFDQQNADKIESYFINKFDTIENGYNLREGGSCGKFSELSKEKMRGNNNPMYGKHPSKETIEKRKKSLGGKNHYNYGKHRSEETKNKLRIANLGKKHSKETKIKIGKSSKGHKLSKKSKEKISVAVKKSKVKKTLFRIDNKQIGTIKYCKRRKKYYAYVKIFNKRFFRYKKTKQEAFLALNNLRCELKSIYKNMSTINKYTYKVMWSKEDNEFVGICLEFPNLSWLDSDKDKALNGIKDVVKGVVKDMLANGIKIPKSIKGKG